jgi:MarR family transcriptional regulator, organic hydroperoxide resistance regulator
MKSPASEAWELLRAMLMVQAREGFGAIRTQHDLSKQQAIALSMLDPDQPLPTSELAEQMFCDASNITGIVDRLETRGLVERRPSPEDRRVRLLALTPAGGKLREEIRERLSAPPEAIAGLSAADQRTLLNLLRH